MAVTVQDLKDNYKKHQNLSLECTCGNFSADPSDYFLYADDHKFGCQSCGADLVLVKRVTQTVIVKE